jgi:hypothetical protein
MDTAIPTTPRTTILTLELSRPGHPAEDSLSTAAWRLVIGEAACCGIQEVRFAGAAPLDREAEHLSAFASAEGLRVTEATPADRCGDGHAAVLTDGRLSPCLRSPLTAGDIRDRSLGELLAAPQWYRAVDAPCAVHAGPREPTRS